MEKLSEYASKLNSQLEAYKIILKKYPDAIRENYVISSKKVKRNFTNYQFIKSSYLPNYYAAHSNRLCLELWDEINVANKIYKVYYSPSQVIPLIEISDNHFDFYPSSFVPKRIFQEYIKHSIDFLNQHPNIKIDCRYAPKSLRKLIPFM